MLIANNMYFQMVRTAWQNAGERRPRMALAYALFIAANLILSLQPVALAYIINAAQQGGEEGMNKALHGALFYAGITVAFWILHGPARVMERRTAFVIYRNFVTSLYAKVTQMPLRWHQDHHSGGIINRVNKAGKALFTFSQDQYVIIQVIARVIASMAAMIYYSWWVALLSITSSFIILNSIRFFDRRLRPLVQITNEREHHLSAGLYDYIGNIITVLTLRLQGNTNAEIGHRYDEMKPSFWREVVINEQKWGVINFLLIFTQAGIVCLYVMLSMRSGKAIALGSVVAVFQYLQNVNMQFFAGTLAYGQLLYHHTDVRGADGLLADHAALVTTQKVIEPRAWQTLSIANLSFRHEEGQDALHTLRHVNFSIKTGQKVALIGSSGSGKTTLLTLLRGLYETQGGTLHLDETAFDTLAPLSSFTSLVPQDSEIFENTVRYNLTLGTNVPDAVLNAALHITTFEDVAPKLPHGLDTDIRERGVNLSGGQKQRLALTRGLIAAWDASLLLLDEPTSSVDLPTEAAIFDRMFATLANKAIVASIHRLHLLPRFDHIIFMRDGMVVEQGSFPELMIAHGEFHHLWQHHLAHAENETPSTV